MAQSDWMARYQNRRPGKIHLPGSHDAGTGNLCNRTLGEIVAQGGGLVCIFDEETNKRIIDMNEKSLQAVTDN